MLSDLDILGREAGSSPPSLSSALGGLTLIKYPPFPPSAKTLAVLASLRYIRRVYSGGLHGEER